MNMVTVAKMFFRLLAVCIFSIFLFQIPEVGITQGELNIPAEHPLYQPIGAHNAMRTVKDNLMVQISNQFNKDYQRASSEMDGSTIELQQNIEKVEHLQRLQK